MTRAMREKRVEHEADELMATLGFTTIRFSHPWRTMQTPGIPDRRYYHQARRLAVWYECKADGEKQSVWQRTFQELVTACGEHYVLGGTEALVSWVEDHWRPPT